MEKYFLENNIKVFCVTADSFPHGILKAHQTLRALLLTTKDRNFFGISFPGREGSIVYKAAVQEAYDGEAEKLNCETFIIHKGPYISATIKHWMKDETIVAKTFQQLLSHPGIDPNGYCLEVYPNETDMICRVKLATGD